MRSVCFNRHVLVGLAVVAAVIAIVAAHLVTTALPLLLLAACPLSMAVIGKALVDRERRSPVEPGGALLTPIDVPYRVEPPRDSGRQLALLHAQLRALGEQQAALAEQIEQLRPAAAGSPSSQTPTDMAPASTTGAVPW